MQNFRVIGKTLYVLPIKIYETLVSVISIFLFSSFKISKKLKNIKQSIDPSNICTILANGPSLKYALEESNFIKNNNVFVAVNDFACTSFFEKIMPTYYVLLDPSIFNLNFNSQNKRLLDAINNVSWNMILYIPYNQKDSAFALNINSEKISKLFFNSTKFVGIRYLQYFAYRKNLGIPSSRNVIIPTILLMLNLGYKKIYLYGIDFSWIKNFEVDENNHFYIKENHFYNSSNVIYYEKGHYKQWLKWIVEMLEGLEKLEDYSRHIGSEIINKTIGSFVDCFKYER